MGVRTSISSVASETGPLLIQYLKDRGVYDPRSEAVVCYGSPVDAPKSLNSKCARGKIYNLKAMTKAGVSLIPWFEGNRIPDGIKFPLLARQKHGHGGTDIVPVFQRKEVEWRVKAGWEWFSSYIPVETEYRVWAFRGEILDTYEKKMVRPEDYKYIGRNFRNGFDFVHTKNHDDASKEAIKVLKALEQDFSAIDMLRGEDGKIYILEANSAPGVIKSGAQATLGKLADRIATWVNDGYPKESR